MSVKAAYYEPDLDGNLQVTCWCGCQVVGVPVAEVREGRTRCCKRRWCKEPT